MNDLKTDLAACVEALEKATPGAWVASKRCLIVTDDWPVHRSEIAACVEPDDVQAIIAAIALLRTHAPAIAELQARCERAESLLRETSDDLLGIGSEPCIGSMAPVEDLHGRIDAHIAAIEATEHHHACDCGKCDVARDRASAAIDASREAGEAASG